MEVIEDLPKWDLVAQFDTPVVIDHIRHLPPPLLKQTHHPAHVILWEVDAQLHPRLGDRLGPVGRWELSRILDA